MRTLPSSHRPAPHPRGSTTSARRSAAAVAVLVGCVAAASALTWVGVRPLRSGRWIYHQIIRVRGGDFIQVPGAVAQSGFADCGPAALATLLVMLGLDPPSTDSIARLAGTDALGTTFSGLQAAAAELGLHSEIRRLPPPAQRRLRTPLIAWVDQGHFVTLIPDAPGVVVVLDPQVGPYRIRRDRLRRYWSGEALIPMPGPVAGLPPHPSISTQGGIS